MIIDDSLQQHYNKMLLKITAERDEKHEPSGKLSASMLYQPLRFQVLRTIGAPRRPIEPYVLGKFQRGNEVEETVVGVAKDLGVLVEAQKMVEYKGAIGYADMVIDTDKTVLRRGIMPWEIKSVTNAKLKRIEKTGVDYHHQLQACMYALAMGSEYYGVVIASGEDNRTKTYIERTRILAPDVNKIIELYERAMMDWKDDHVLPPFEANPKVPWTGNPNYAMFEPFWIEGSDSEILKKLTELKLI